MNNVDNGSRLHRESRCKALTVDDSGNRGYISLEGLHWRLKIQQLRSECCIRRLMLSYALVVHVLTCIS